jgi:hypothetical protein
MFKDDIDRAERGAESEQRGAEQRRCAGKGEPRQDDGEAKPANKDDRLAAVPRAQDACQQHRHNGPNPEAEQKQAEDTVINCQPLLRERYQRRPRRDTEAGDEKSKTRR